MREDGKSFWEYNLYYRAIAVVLNVALVILALWLHYAWGKDRLQVGAAVALLILVGVLDIYIKETNDKRRARKVEEAYIAERENYIKELKESYVREILEAATISVSRAARPPRDHIRVNLMFPDHNGNLVIRYDHGFTPDDKDKHIKIPIGTGCSGQAWLQREARAADVSQLTRDHNPDDVYTVNWGLPKEEIAKIRPTLQSIFSIPIKARSKDTLIATLSFDSDNTIEEMKFNDRAIQQIIYSFATIMEDLLENIPTDSTHTT